MKNLFNIKLVLIACAFLYSCAPTHHNSDKNSRVTVDLMISKSSDYCGGANPGQEIVDNLKQEKKYESQELFILKADSKSVDEVVNLKTDELGKVQVELAAGSYKVYLKEKWNFRTKNYKTQSDNSCEKWMTNGNATLVVKSDVKEYNLNLHSTCNPCESPSR